LFRPDILHNPGVIGACEDQSEHDLHSQFETNFFGTLNILSLSLPLFRRQSHGRYLIFASTAGALGVPGLGPYCAAKFAVEGLLESMLYEVDAFGIKATLVEPGHLRLNEPDARHEKHSAAKFKVIEPSDAYADVTAPAQHAQRMVRWLADRQSVSTARSAELAWQLAHCRYPPLRLLLGSYAVESIRDRMRCIIEEVS
jgi:NAD(P)-dependent dehydrogenase (short-subunit alcohol dehydrogenase family)